VNSNFPSNYGLMSVCVLYTRAYHNQIFTVAILYIYGQTSGGKYLTFIQRYLPISTAGLHAAACAQSVESPSVDRASVFDHSCLYRSRRPWRDLMGRLCVATRSAAWCLETVSYRIAIFCVISYHTYRFLLQPYRAITKNDN